MIAGAGGLTARKGDRERNRREGLGRKRGEDETALGRAAGAQRSLEPNRARRLVQFSFLECFLEGQSEPSFSGGLTDTAALTEDPRLA